MEDIFLAKNDRTQTIHGKKARYRTLSLVNLIREIADKSDLQALHEFHNNRPVFSYNNGPPVVLIEYRPDRDRHRKAKNPATIGSSCQSLPQPYYRGIS